MTDHDPSDDLSDDLGPVGFIGLGAIGAPIARHLLAHPGGLVVCDVSAEAVAPFVEAGAVASPREVGERCRVVSVMVRDDEQVRSVVAGPDGIAAGAAPGTVIAIHPTIRAETATGDRKGVDAAFERFLATSVP